MLKYCIESFRTLSLIAIALLATGPTSKSGWAADRDARTEIILSGLPDHNSSHYKSLRSLAAPVDVQTLEMTRSEMWSVPQSHLEALAKAANSQGITVTVLDNSWNHMLAPMPTGATMTQTQTEMMHQAMDSKAAMGVSMMALPQSNVLEYALTKSMAKAKSNEPPPTLVIPLNATTSVSAKRTSIAKSGEGYVWHGTVGETGDPVTLLWWPSGRLTGTIHYHGHIYAVKNMGDGMHGVVEMEPRMLPPEHAPMSPDLMHKMNMQEDPLVKRGDASMVPQQVQKNPKAEGEIPPDRRDTKNQEDAPLSEAAGNAVSTKIAPDTPARKSRERRPDDVTITLIVAYTKQAASHYTDIEKDLIMLAVEEANQSLVNSKVDNVQFKLVHAYETDYMESGTHFDHVFRFAYDHDGYMDEIHRLRDQYGADVAILVEHDPHGCGLSAQVAASADKAFAAVHHECAALGYSLAHELGHLIGARHDEALDDSKTPFPYGHGFINGTTWRTMMSYEESCSGCPRIPVWSNPDVIINGVHAGTETANNARVIREAASRVAGFKSAPKTADAAFSKAEKGDGNLIAAAKSADDLKQFSRAIAATDLGTMLSGKGPFTVFAPTDAAFAKLSKETFDALFSLENRKVLQDILMHHVIYGKVVKANRITEAKHMRVKMASGQMAEIEARRRGGARIDGAKLVGTELSTQNGIIHRIDTVIIPSTSAAALARIAASASEAVPGN